MIIDHVPGGWCYLEIEPPSRFSILADIDVRHLHPCCILFILQFQIPSVCGNGYQRVDVSGKSKSKKSVHHLNRDYRDR